jgi:hypothetical protein
MTASKLYSETWFGDRSSLYKTQSLDFLKKRYKTYNSGVFAKSFLPWKVSYYQILWACLYTCLNNLACKLFLYWTVWLYHKSSTLPYEGAVFKQRFTEYKMCVLISSTILFKIFLILRRNGRERDRDDPKCVLVFV